MSVDRMVKEGEYGMYRRTNVKSTHTMRGFYFINSPSVFLSAVKRAILSSLMISPLSKGYIPTVHPKRHSVSMTTLTTNNFTIYTTHGVTK